MTDNTMGSGYPLRKSKTAGMEYGIYFAIIFLLCLPGALLAWIFDPARDRKNADENGILGRARSQARIITPMIFSA